MISARRFFCFLFGGAFLVLWAVAGSAIIFGLWDGPWRPDALARVDFLGMCGLLLLLAGDRSQ